MDPPGLLTSFQPPFLYRLRHCAHLHLNRTIPIAHLAMKDVLFNLKPLTLEVSCIQCILTAGPTSGRLTRVYRVSRCTLCCRPETVRVDGVSHVLPVLTKATGRPTRSVPMVSTLSLCRAERHVVIRTCSPQIRKELGVNEFWCGRISTVSSLTAI